MYVPITVGHSGGQVHVLCSTWCTAVYMGGGGGVPQCAVGNGLGVLHIGVRI